jgi:hypothetical protein
LREQEVAVIEHAAAHVARDLTPVTQRLDRHFDDTPVLP